MTKFAVSNIAWPAAQRDAAYRILAEAGIGGLEIAPGLFLPHAEDPFRPTRADKEAALSPMRDAGLTLVSMQSLLFGVQGAALFGTETERATFEAAILRAIDLAGELAIPNMVFGSPRQRAIPDGLDRSAAETRGRGGLPQARRCRAIRRNAHRARAQCARLRDQFPQPRGRNRRLRPVGRSPCRRAQFRYRRAPCAGRFRADRDHRLPQSPIAPRTSISASPRSRPAPRDPAQAARVLTAIQRAGYNGWYSIEMAATPDCIRDLTSAIARLRAAEPAAAGRTITDD